MKKEDEETFDFDEFKVDKKESILEKKYKKLMSLKVNDQTYREKTSQEKLILLSYGFLLGGLYGISLGLTISFYFSFKYKMMFKRQFYIKCVTYSGLIFGTTLGVYSFLFFEPQKIKDKMNFFKPTKE